MAFYFLSKLVSQKRTDLKRKIHAQGMDDMVDTYDRNERNYEMSSVYVEGTQTSPNSQMASNDPPVPDQEPNNHHQVQSIPVDGEPLETNPQTYDEVAEVPISPSKQIAKEKTDAESQSLKP